MLSNYNKLSNTRSAKIIGLLKAKDKSGLSLLYEYYGPALFRILTERIPQKEVAKEALQDVLMKIWTNIEKYDDKKGRFFTWMARITKNYAIDVLRSKKYKHGAKTDSLPDYVHNDSSLSEETYIQDSGLRNVLKKLSPQEQRVIELLYFKGYTQKETSEELDIPLGTVKTRARRAIKTLRGILGDEGLMRLLLLV